MLKFMLNLDNAFNRTSPLWALSLGWSATISASEGNMWMTVFNVALAIWYARMAMKASEAIARNNEMMEELNAPTIQEIKAEDISSYTITGFWNRLEEKYPDKSRLEILLKREADITKIIQSMCKQAKVSQEEHFEIKVFTPLGQNQELRTEVSPKTDKAKALLLELSRAMKDQEVSTFVREIEE